MTQTQNKNNIEAVSCKYRKEKKNDTDLLVLGDS